MFKEERDEPLFEWSMLGDVGLGRPNLGDSTSVSVYRLMQFTMRDVLIQRYGVAEADRLFYEAGENAGRALYQKLITPDQDLERFFEQLQGVLKELKVAILRMEKSDAERLHFVLTAAEDLDCSGLPLCDETICTYDEGFLAGLFAAHTGKRFRVKEVDCWCSGDRVCRFDVRGED